MVTLTTLTRRGSVVACGFSLQPTHSASSGSNRQMARVMRTFLFIFQPDKGRMRWTYSERSAADRPLQIYGDRLAGLEQCRLLRLRPRLDPVMQLRSVSHGRFRRGK